MKARKEIAPLNEPGRRWVGQYGPDKLDRYEDEHVWLVDVSVTVTVAVSALDSDDATGLGEERVRVMAPDMESGGDIRVDDVEYIEAEREGAA